MNASIASRAGTVVFLTAFAIPLTNAAFAEDTAPANGLALLGDEPSYVGIGAGVFNMQGHTSPIPPPRPIWKSEAGRNGGTSVPRSGFPPMPTVVCMVTLAAMPI
jgi:hypothetical protein